MEENKKLVDTIVKGIQEKKGQDIVVVDLSSYFWHGCFRSSLSSIYKKNV